MLYYRIQGLKSVYYSILMIVFTAIYWGYLLLSEVYLNPKGGYLRGQYLLYNIAGLAALVMAAMNSHRVHDCLLRHGLTSNHRIAVMNAAYVAATILSISVLLKDAAVSRFFLFTFFPLLYFAFLFSHQVIPRMLVRNFFSNGHQHRALLVGPLDKVRMMKRWCECAAALGLDVCNVSGEWERIPGLSPGDLKDLEEAIGRERADQIVLLEFPSSRKTCSDIVSLCNRLGIRLLVVNNLPELFQQGVSFFTLYGVGFIQVRDEPLENPVNRLLKRGLDIAISVPVVLLVLPPVALVVAILHRLQSPGPLFFFQTRAGMSRRPFRIVKFRTMHARSRAASKQATANDERVFRAGRWLRKSSLDELPQFLNVLRGEMSVVGPRPHMLVHDRRFCHGMNSYHIRNFVKPGITGLAQIKGFRGEATEKTAIEERVKYDIEYLEHWSLWRDILIVLQTSKQIISPVKTAY